MFSTDTVFSEHFKIRSSVGHMEAESMDTTGQLYILIIYK